jgi:hypothetical protein
MLSLSLDYPWVILASSCAKDPSGRTGRCAGLNLRYSMALNAIQSSMQRTAPQERMILAVTLSCELEERLVLRVLVPDEEMPGLVADELELEGGVGEDGFVALAVLLLPDEELLALPPEALLTVFVLLMDVEVAVGCTTMPALTTQDRLAVSENPVRHSLHTPGHDDPISSTSLQTFGTQVAP